MTDEPAGLTAAASGAPALQKRALPDFCRRRFNLFNGLKRRLSPHLCRIAKILRPSFDREFRHAVARLRRDRSAADSRRRPACHEHQSGDMRSPSFEERPQALFVVTRYGVPDRRPIRESAPPGVDLGLPGQHAKIPDPIEYVEVAEHRPKDGIDQREARIVKVGAV